MPACQRLRSRLSPCQPSRARGMSALIRSIDAHKAEAHRELTDGFHLIIAIRAAVSGRPGGVYLDLPAKLFGQVVNADAGRKSLVKVIDAAPAQVPSPSAVKRGLDVLKGAKRPLIILGKGVVYDEAANAINYFLSLHGALPRRLAV